MPDSLKDTVNVEIEVSIQMAGAGARVYRAWKNDPTEQRKLNAVANLVSRVYAAMEREARHHEEVDPPQGGLVLG